jgi:hypothetical protein
MYCPFKGQKDGLSRCCANWNFIQSLIQMYVEQAFGVLKERWKIIMKQSNVPLQMVPDLVCICIVVYNLYITMKDSFDKTSIDEAESELTQKIVNGEAREGSEVRSAQATIEEMRDKI